MTLHLQRPKISLGKLFRWSPQSLGKPQMLAAGRKTYSSKESNSPLVVSFGVGYYHSHLFLPEPLFQSFIEAKAQVRPLERLIHSYPAHIPIFFPGGAFFLNGSSQNEANDLSCYISYQAIIRVRGKVVGYFVGTQVR